MAKHKRDYYEILGVTRSSRCSGAEVLYFKDPGPALSPPTEPERRGAGKVQARLLRLCRYQSTENGCATTGWGTSGCPPT